MKPINVIYTDLQQALKKVTVMLPNDDLEKDVENAFIEFINIFINIGSYNKERWNFKVLRSLYGDFERISKEHANFPILLTVVRNKIEIEVDVRRKEPMEYLELELMNALCSTAKDVTDFHSEAISLKAKTYSHNTEFIYAYAQLLSYDDDTLEQAVELGRRCFNRWGIAELPNQNFVSPLSRLIQEQFNIEIKYIKHLIKQEKYEQAESVAYSMMQLKEFTKDSGLNNIILVTIDRILDRKQLELRAKKLTQKVMAGVKEENDNQNKKSIEHLGLFSAVITFIITAAAAAFNSKEALTPIILISIGLILVLMVSTLSLCNNPPRKFFKDIRSLMVIFYGALTIAIISFELTRPTFEEIIDNKIQSEKYISTTRKTEEYIHLLVDSEIKKRAISESEFTKQENDLKTLVENVVSSVLARKHEEIANKERLKIKLLVDDSFSSLE